MSVKTHYENWHEIRYKLKQKFPQLTKSDLHDRGGEEDDIIQMVAFKLKMSHREMREIISQL